MPAIKPGANTSFGQLKQIDAGVLHVGYAEAGPNDASAGSRVRTRRRMASRRGRSEPHVSRQGKLDCCSCERLCRCYG
jgi:hypothetical protein